MKYYVTVAGDIIKMEDTENVPINICPSAPIPPVNSWIPLTQLEQMANQEYDVLIVGSGAGGAAALWRLCQQWKGMGMRVGIVEQGDAVLPTNARNLSIMSGRLDNYFTYLSRPVPDLPEARVLYALGGRTLFWNAIIPRIQPSVFADWPISYEELKPYYNIAELMLKLSTRPPLTFPLPELLLSRLWTGGFPEATYSPMALEYDTLSVSGRIHSEVYFSSFSFMAEALNHLTFDLAVRSRAVQILTENNAVQGVKVMSRDKKTYELRAKNVVLSASWLETPRLLLNSGIPGRAIGHYLTNHSFVRASGTFRPEDTPINDVQYFDLLIPQTENSTYQIQIFRTGRIEDRRIAFLALGIVEPRYENQIRLNPYQLDEDGIPRVQVDYSYSARDLATIQLAARADLEAIRAAGLTPDLENGRPSVCLRPIGYGNHEAGTCRMGNDPDTSATDRYGQIHGIDGLYVADNSIIPFMGASNPTLTTVALAIRTADRIVRTMPRHLLSE